MSFLILKYKENTALMSKPSTINLSELCRYIRLGEKTFAFLEKQKLSINDLLKCTTEEIELLQSQKTLGYGAMMRILYWKQAYYEINNTSETKNSIQTTTKEDSSESSSSSSSSSSDDSDNSSDNGEAYDIESYAGHHWCCGIKRKREDEPITVEDELKARNIIANDPHTEADNLFFCRLNRIGGMCFVNEEGSNGDISFYPKTTQITFIGNSMMWKEYGRTHLLRDTEPVTHIDGVPLNTYKKNWVCDLFN